MEKRAYRKQLPHKRKLPAPTALANSGRVKKGGKGLRSLKNQIRGVERLLNKDTLDGKARAQQETKLQELREAVAQHAQAEKERKYALRYHKVRFFERRKLERRIQKLEAKHKATEAGWSDADRAVLSQLHEDLQYVVHFPKGEKYVSILRQAEGEEAQAQLQAERTRLRTLVRRQLAEVAMVTEADEGRSLMHRAAALDSQAAAAEEAEEEDDFFMQSGDEAAEEPREAKQQLEDATSSDDSNTSNAAADGAAGNVAGTHQPPAAAAGNRRSLPTSLANGGGGSPLPMQAKQQTASSERHKNGKNGKPFLKQRPTPGQVGQAREQTREQTLSGSGGFAGKGKGHAGSKAGPTAKRTVVKLKAGKPLGHHLQAAPVTQPAGPKPPLRTRKEGGRKRRKKI